MIDADVMELRNVEHIIGAEAVRVDDAIRLDLFLEQIPIILFHSLQL